MTRRALLLSCVLLLVATVAPAQEREIRLQGLSGGELREGELSQGTSILVFWTSWSPRGKDIVARVNALADRWSSRAKVVTVNFEEESDVVRDFLAGQPRLKVPVYLDSSGDLSKKHRVHSAPWLLVIKDGQAAFSEKLPQDPNAVISQILGS